MYCAGVSCQMRVLVTPCAAPGKNSDPSATLAEGAVPPGPNAPGVPAVLDDECWPWLSAVQPPTRRRATPMRGARAASDQLDRCLGKRIGNAPEQRHSFQWFDGAAPCQRRCFASRNASGRGRASDWLSSQPPRAANPESSTNQGKLARRRSHLSSYYWRAERALHWVTHGCAELDVAGFVGDPVGGTRLP